MSFGVQAVLGSLAEMKPVVPEQGNACGGNMKKILLVVIAAIFCESARAEISVSGYGSFDVSSAYVLYGARMNKEPCYWTYLEMVVADDLFGGIGASLWQNADMTSRRNEVMRRMNEWDWAVFYRNQFHISDEWQISLEAGNIWYKYHGLKGEGVNLYKTMMELYGRLQLDNPFLTPYVAMFHDWKITDGTFAQAGLKRDISLIEEITFTPDFTVGGGDRRYLACLYPPWGEGGVSSGISYVQLSGKVAYWFNEHFGVHALVAYCVIVDDEIREGIDADMSDYQKQYAWGCVGVDVAF